MKNEHEKDCAYIYHIVQKNILQNKKKNWFKVLLDFPEVDAFLKDDCSEFQNRIPT